MTQGVYLNIPRADWTLLQELINRFGWQSETREQMLEEFMQTRPMNVDLTEEDITNEVRAVRYAWWKSLILSFADSIEADYIISGDKDLTDLEKHRDTRLLSPTQFRLII